MMARLQEVASQEVAHDGLSAIEEEDVRQAEQAGETDGDSEKAVGDNSSVHGEKRTPESVDKEGGNVSIPGASDGGKEGTGGVAVGLEDEWVEETVEHPAPDYGVDSPVIR